MAHQKTNVNFKYLKAINNQCQNQNFKNQIKIQSAVEQIKYYSV